MTERQNAMFDISKLVVERWRYVCAAVLLISTIIPGMYYYILAEQQTNLAKEALRCELTNVLEITHEGISAWAVRVKADASLWADSELIRWETQTLLELWEGTGELNSPEVQGPLRCWYNEVNQWLGYSGYFVITPGGTNLASSRDANVGTRNLLVGKHEFLDKVADGDVRISPPLPSEVPLVNRYGLKVKGTPTMFAGAPIKNEKGEVAALFTLRMDPENSLYRILDRGRFGKTGETYIFDRDGMLVSHSRFSDELHQRGLVEQWVGEELHIEAFSMNLREEEDATRLGRPSRPADALLHSGELEVNMEGYLDYRGDRVVGVWLWDDELDIGLIVEKETGEAYAGLHNSLRDIRLSAIAIGALLMIVLGSVTYFLRKISLSAREYETLFNSSLDAVLVIDEDGISDVNQVAVDLFGYDDRESIIGLHPSDLSPEVQPDGLPSDEAAGAHIEKVLTTGASIFDWFHKRYDGTVFPAQILLSNASGGGKLRVQGIVRDMTAEKELLAAQIAAAEAARATDAQKNDFIANISHEVRTPINIINGMLAHIRENATGTIKSSVDKCVRAAERLNQVFDSMMAFNTIQDRVQVSRSTVYDLQGIIERMNHKFSAYAEKKGLTLNFVIDSGIPRKLVGDPEALQQVISGLLDNAIKFTSYGSVNLSLRAQTTTSSTTLTLVVHDTGIGIAKSEQETIFLPFTQIDGSSTRREGGIGMGLAVGRKLVELMGGSLSVYSEVDMGSEFTMVLPQMLPQGMEDVEFVDFTDHPVETPQAAEQEEPEGEQKTECLENVRNELVRLRTLLGNSDSRAKDSIGALAPELEKMGYAAEAYKIRDHVEGYDFDAALALLEPLLEKSGAHEAGGETGNE